MKEKVQEKCQMNSGLTLVEVVLAVGLVAMGLALILATMVHVRERERKAREQNLSWAFVEQLQAELSLGHTWQAQGEEMVLGWSDEGRLLEGNLPLDGQGFASSEVPFALAFDYHERSLGLVDEEAYAAGMGEGTEAVGVLAFWGNARDAVMEVEARAEFPAALPASRRRRYEVSFVVSLRR